MENEDKEVQEFEELLKKLDHVTLKAFHALLKALNEGEDMDTATSEAVSILLSYNRIEAAAKLNEYARKHKERGKAEC